jgi:hypothetical protein
MLAALVAAGRAQGQPPASAAVPLRYLEVDARVTDAQGTLVRGLRKEDFRLLEDGVEQALETFAAVDIPIDARRPIAGVPVVPDVVTNTDHVPGKSRFYVLLLDDRSRLLDLAPHHLGARVVRGCRRRGRRGP